MFRRLLLIVTIVSLMAPPAHAQLAVIDPANLIQTTLIAYRMQQHYAELRAEYLTVLRIAQGLGSGDGNRTVVIAGGVGDATSQATLQVMNRFLNRLPTITIREGHRVKVYLTSDIELPTYVAPGAPNPF